MSGITGAISRVGQPVIHRELEAMVSVLAHRGPDGAGLWAEGPVGLGHRLLITTPESALERLPFTSHGLSITADARIDNREDLAKQLGLDLRLLHETTDPQLILFAYLHWGKDCPEKLLGDFAFAIWDSRAQEIFCARDPFGVKPFYYALNEEWFLFGSEIKAILCSPHASRRLNEAWLARFLLPVSDFSDKTSTYYTGVLRLPPAHSLVVSPRSSALSCYWELDPEREIHFKDEADYVEGLKEHFTRAVRVRMRSAFPVGSTLSGGLDSSSIACTLRNLSSAVGGPPVHTFSAVFQDAPEADESEYIHAVLDQGGFIPHMLHPDQGSPFVDIERVLWHLDEPFYGINYFMPWSFYRSASENGVRVLMDGTDGDTTISHGMDYFEVLAQSHNWKQFATEARAVTRNFDHPGYASVASILYGYGTPYLTRLARQGKWIRFARDVQQVGELFHVSRKRLAVNWGVKPLLPPGALFAIQRIRGKKLPPKPFPAHIAPEFLRRLEAQGFFQRSNHSGVPARQNGRALHAYFLNIGMLPYTLEMINRLSSAFAVDVRVPFCDRQLVEYCLALPPQMKLKEGWSRYIMRKAMTGVLPEKVQWRGGKISLAKVYPYMLHRNGKDYAAEILAHPPELLDRYFNVPMIRDMFRSFIKDKNLSDLEWVWQTVVFAAWLKQTGCVA